MVNRHNLTKLLKLVFSSCFILALSACSSNDDTVATAETVAEIPQVIQKFALNTADQNASLLAWITITKVGDTQIPTRTPLTIDSAAGTVSASFFGLSRTTYTVLIEFEFTDGVDTITLATVIGTFDLSSGDASLSFTEADYDINFDNDSDRINNVTEIINGTDPLIPNTPTITVTDSVPPNDDLLVSFGDVMIGDTSDKAITITNDGSSDLKVGRIGNVDPLDVPNSITVDNCSDQTLTPAASCTLTIRFAPSSVGTFNDSFDIPSNDPIETSLTVNISGTGDPVPVPNIVISDAVVPNDDRQVPFGNTTVGSTSSSTVTITNDGTSDLVLGTIGGSNALASPFGITVDNCSGQALTPASNCSLTLQFTPSSTGPFNDAFDIPSNDPDEASVTVSVSGIGDPAVVPNIVITDTVAPIDDRQVPFGNTAVGSTSSSTVTITNDGTSDLVLGTIGGSNALASPFGITVDNCSGQALTPASNCSLTLQFAPSSTGPFNDAFDIPSNDRDEASVTISVSGIGDPVSVPNIVISDAVIPNDDRRVPFGNTAVGSTSSSTVTITNDGTSDLVLGTIGGSNALASPFGITVDNCSGQALTPASNCILTLQFTPSSTGPFNDAFDIPSNDPDEASVTVSVSGIGDPALVPNIVITDTVAPIDDRRVPFGNTAVGSTSSSTVTITNDGTSDLVLGTIGGSNSLASPFGITVDNCSGQALTPASNCSLTLQFTPSSTGPFNDAFDIPSNDRDEASVTMNVSGTAILCQISASQRDHGKGNTSPGGLGQSFTACACGVIRVIQLDILSIDNPNARIELQTGDTSWSSSYSQNINLSTGKNLIQLKVPFQVKNRGTYSFGVFPSTGDLSLWSDLNSYAGGENFFISGSSLIRSVPTTDLVFDLQIE